MACLNASQSISYLQILIILLISSQIYGGVVEEAVEITSNIDSNNSNNNNNNQREFDYFALALQWPGTYCRRTRSCCSSNACCRGSNAPTEFTIHGLWPDYNDGSWPSCCTRSSFDIKEVSTLLEALQKYWPSLSCGSTSTCNGKKGLFWAHEWGTVAKQVFKDRELIYKKSLNTSIQKPKTALNHTVP